MSLEFELKRLIQAADSLMSDCVGEDKEIVRAFSTRLAACLDDERKTLKEFEKDYKNGERRPAAFAVA